MRFATFGVVVGCLSGAAFDQTGGTITGVISDPTGAVVPDAPVQAKNIETGVIVTAATSATGNYTLNELP